MTEQDRMPSTDSLWSTSIDTRFGLDYLSIEPAIVGNDQHRAVYIHINETTDPIDGYQEAHILLHTTEQVRLLIVGLIKATKWLNYEITEQT